MIRPPAPISAAARRDRSKGATRFTLSMVRTSSRECSSSAQRSRSPTLFTRKSRPPSRSTSNADATATSSATSNTRGCTSPSARSLSAAASARDASRPFSRIRAPAWASAFAISNPSPCVAPVTSAVFPASVNGEAPYTVQYTVACTTAFNRSMIENSSSMNPASTHHSSTSL